MRIFVLNPFDPRVEYQLTTIKNLHNSMTHENENSIFYLHYRCHTILDD